MMKGNTSSYLFLIGSTSPSGSLALAIAVVTIILLVLALAVVFVLMLILIAIALHLRCLLCRLSSHLRKYGFDVYLGLRRSKDRLRLVVLTESC